MGFLAVALKWLMGGLGSLWRAVAAHPWQTAVIALLCLSAGLWRHSSHLSDQLTAARAGIAAGQDNVKRLRAEKAATEKRDAATTERVDHDTVSARRDALAASDDYARYHRCVRPSAPAAPAGRDRGTGVPGAPAAAGRAAASGENGELVAVDKPDFDACTLNTTDLQKAFEWARDVYGNHAAP